jgi:hypothetical protein
MEVLSSYGDGEKKKEEKKLGIKIKMTIQS